MISAPIQNFFIQPRQGKDPRVAKTDGTTLAVGSDGKLYKMAERSDWEKYRTLSDNELRDELSKSVEIKENMYMLNGKLNKGKYGSRSSGIKLVAPQFGTQSRSRKKEKRQWEQDLQHMTEGASPGATTSQYHDTMAALVRNQTGKDASERGSSCYPDETSYTFHAPNGGSNVAQSSEDRIHAAVSTMKQKYEQNLHVVEQLFDEKKYMERKIQLLERRLQQHVGDEDAAEDAEFEGVDPSTYASYAERPPTYEELSDNDEGPRTMKHSSFEPSFRGSRAGQAGYSAAELAALMEHTRRRGSAAHRPQSAPTRRDPRRTSPDQAGGVGEGGGHARRSDTLRSSSASGRRSVTACSVSANLQADADRYIQKRRMWEEQERQKKLEEERYEQRLKERYLRASMNGKEFTEMRRRQEIADQQSQVRLQKFQQKQAELEEAARSERRAKLEANKASLAMVTKNQLSWRELQEIEEAKRRDRIERRKQELAQVSALPSSIAENLQKSKREAGTTPASNATVGFKAEDPAKVAAKLARAQKVWELKMDRERERIKEKSGRLGVAGGGSGSLGSAAKSAMEVRTEQYAAKRDAKAKEREEREKAEAQRLREEEDKRRERLLNTRVPVGKPTNSAILKADKVRSDRLKEEEEERRMRAHLRKKEISTKEASAVLRTIVAEREIERHGGSGGHFELRSSGLAEAQRKAAETAAAAREEYRNQLRANKKRIQDSLQNRQSLMERHDKALAMKTATQEALQKVAGAVGLDAGARTGASGKGQRGGGADSVDHLDLFDAKEQVRLGLKTI